MLIDDHDFIISYEIVDITLIDCCCFESIFYVVKVIEVLADVDIIHSEIGFEFRDASLCEGRSFLLLIDLIVILI